MSRWAIEDTIHHSLTLRSYGSHVAKSYRKQSKLQFIGLSLASPPTNPLASTQASITALYGESSGQRKRPHLEELMVSAQTNNPYTVLMATPALGVGESTPMKEKRV